MAYIEYFYTLNIKSYLLLIFLTNFYALSQLATSHTQKKRKKLKNVPKEIATKKIKKLNLICSLYFKHKHFFFVFYFQKTFFIWDIGFFLQTKFLFFNVS